MDHLLIAEFAVSNYVNASIGVTLFFTDHGFHLQTGIESPRTYKKKGGKRQAELLIANKIVA